MFLGVGLSLAVVTFSGCGGKKTGKTETSSKDRDKDGSNGGGNADIQPNNGEVAAAGRSRRGVWKNNGQKYWNNHPYDIWYSDAYAVAGEGQPVGSTGTGKTVASNGKEKPGKEPSAKKAAPKSSGDWKAIISGELLDRPDPLEHEIVGTEARGNSAVRPI